MSVSFNSSLVANQKVAFGRNSETGSDSYVGSTAKGAVAGGVIGAGIGFAVKKASAMEVAGDKFIFSKAKNVAEKLSGSAPVKKFAYGGVAVGAIALLLRAITNNNKVEDSAARLKPIS